MSVLRGLTPTSMTHSRWCVLDPALHSLRVSVVFPKRHPGNKCGLDRSEFISAPSGGALDNH